jgi:hypothetical protein
LKNSPQREESFKDFHEKAGISKVQAERWQKLAEIPEDDFEATFAGSKKKPTTAGLFGGHGSGARPTSGSEAGSPVIILALRGGSSQCRSF